MFFSALWKIISPVMDPRTKAKLSITSSNVSNEMLEYIGAENVPVMYGGMDKCMPGEAPEERALLEHVLRNRARIAEGGVR